MSYRSCRSATLTYTADDGDAHTNRCFLVFKMNVKVTDESLLSLAFDIELLGLVVHSELNSLLLLTATKPNSLISRPTQVPTWQKLQAPSLCVKTVGSLFPCLCLPFGATWRADGLLPLRGLVQSPDVCHINNVLLPGCVESVCSA